MTCFLHRLTCSSSLVKRNIFRVDGITAPFFGR